MIPPVSEEEFSGLLHVHFGDVLHEQSDVALGLSGGPDSVALLRLLSDWAAENDGPMIHALIVDHGLRSESEKEARQVVVSLAGLRYVRLDILKWEGEKPETGVQEGARKARYELMSTYCRAQKIKFLFLAHHQDDQAETFLFRLAKGSGLDGLAGMKHRQARGELILLRPLLDIPKARLIATCKANDLPYIQDPSNESEKFARVRLRKSMPVLEAEGLSVKRLAVTAARLGRARAALEQITDHLFEQALIGKNTKQIVLDFKVIKNQPEEIALRLVLQVFEALRPDADYAPRMEKIEALICDLRQRAAFRKRTLGGLIFVRDDKAQQVKIQIEESG